MTEKYCEHCNKPLTSCGEPIIGHNCTTGAGGAAAMKINPIEIRGDAYFSFNLQKLFELVEHNQALLSDGYMFETMSEVMLYVETLHGAVLKLSQRRMKA